MVPVSLRLVPFLGGTSKLTLGTLFRFKWQYMHWEVFPVRASQSLRQATLTMMDLGSKAARCTSESDQTLDSATQAIPALKTWSERSMMAQSSDKP